MHAGGRAQRAVRAAQSAHGGRGRLVQLQPSEDRRVCADAAAVGNEEFLSLVRSHLQVPLRFQGAGRVRGGADLRAAQHVRTLAQSPTGLSKLFLTDHLII